MAKTSCLLAVRVAAYRPEWKSYFKSLNAAWIEKYFKLEPEDERILDNPEESILKAGGQIFFAYLEESGQVVGTCALIPHGNALELAKMAVDESIRGQGIGKHLMQASVDYARTAGVEAIELETSSHLPNAIKLYERFGFLHTPVSPDTKFARADVAMRLNLV